MIETFIGGAIVGGLIYDALKLGVSGWENLVRVALKDYFLSDQEIAILTNGLENASLSNSASKEEIESALRGDSEAKRVVEKITNNSGNINTGTFTGMQGGSGNTYINGDQINGGEKKN